ncbi:putative ABC transport system permease protein [Parapedobacter luteus]|uniref:Putative ABC transport system permease protein n=1 Tax=Parapedobacter luteus TaxID=623280 RepID=A0A1T5EAB0_9SPHI|nr:ABC transporter permease [Parapedobacter luteus]SKB80992.1 putative ABC transport system permease protein [Parapedobacter luteus]
MIKNYFKTAWRNLRKNRMFTTLNVIGLALGLTGFMLIAGYVLDELSYDRFHAHADRIVRANTHIKIGESKLEMARTSDMMGPVLHDEYPEVEAFARLYNSSGSKLMKKGDRWINEARVAHVDSTFFRLFSYQALQGDLAHALDAPNSVVLTRSAAKRYFNAVDVVGKTLETDDAGNTVYQVTGVIEDMPRNSHFNYDFLFSMENAEYGDWGAFLSHNFTTYLLLRSAADRPVLEEHLAHYVQKYCLPAAKQFMELSSMEEFRKQGNVFYYDVTPITDIHLHSNLMGELSPNGSMQYVYIFGAVSAFILLIACINFMNLSTARSANRAKDVGVRKILGSSRAGVAGQFLAESLLLAFGATLIAVGIVILVTPLFNELSGKAFRASDFLTIKTLPLIILLALFVGILAGYYPAAYLSRFNPLGALKSRAIVSSGKSPLRSGLVVFQFATSIVLIVGTLIVTAQLRYIQHKKLGYDRENMVVIGDFNVLGNQAKAFREEILKLPGVKAATISGYLPVSSSSRSDNSFSSESVMSATNSVSMQTWRVDDQYLPTFGLELVSGRNFSAARPADSAAVILNETAAKHFGYGNDAIGKKIYFTFGGDVQSYDIIGVVKDFNFESLRDPVTPLGFFLANHPAQAAFKVETANLPTLLSRMEDTWNKMAPGFPFSYQFLDDAFDNMYRAERRVGQLSLAFAGMAIVIACLGLFGLAAFMAEQRTKEIGIRKVLGASVTGLIRLLSFDFLKLVGIAIILAIPVAWWAMSHWLEDFAYRIEIKWWMFAAAGLVAVLIALLTVSGQAIRAALTNPVDSLRDE